eukprot:scaffold1957_cov110-Isochrysis_galbana.AAC.2
MSPSSYGLMQSTHSSSSCSCSSCVSSTGGSKSSHSPPPVLLAAHADACSWLDVFSGCRMAGCDALVAADASGSSGRDAICAGME